MRCRAIIEVMGKPKEHVESSIKKYVEQIKGNPELIIVKDKYEPIKEIEGLFSTFVELEMAVKNITAFVGFCFDYMPSSIEIIRPERLVIMNNEMSGFLNDLQARLHNTDMLLKRLTAESDVLKKNLHNSFINVISILLSVKGKLSLEEIARFSGIEKNQLEKFLSNMAKNNKVKKDGDKFALVGVNEKN